jgi:hypothetical protein
MSLDFASDWMLAKRLWLTGSVPTKRLLAPARRPILTPG